MALFSRKKPAAPPPSGPVVPYVLLEGESPLFGELHAALDAKDFARARAVVEKSPVTERSTLAGHFSEKVPYDWAVAHADDPLGQTLAGVCAVTTGWRARSSKRAESVTRDQFETFHQWLERADVHLLAGSDGEGTDPTPTIYLLASARGLEKPIGYVETVFAELKRRDPQNLRGHQQRLQYSCDKWFGTHDQMFAFAHGVTDTAPAGSPLHIIMLEAHLERQMSFSGEAKHAQRVDYLSRPDVVASIDSSVAKLPDGFPKALGLNMLAYFAWVRSDRAAFTAALAAAELRVTPSPWNLYGDDPIAVVRKRGFGKG